MLREYFSSLGRFLARRYDVILRFIAFATILNVAVAAFAISQQPIANTPEQVSSSKREKETSWRDPIVVLTIVIAVFNGSLVIVTFLLVDSTNKLWKISERTLTELEQPYLFVFDVSNIISEQGEEWHDHDHYIEYSIANYGSRPAIIEGAWIGFESSDKAEPALPPRVGDNHVLATAPILAVGETRKIREYLPFNTVEGDIFVDNEQELSATPFSPARIVSSSGLDFFFRVLIEYRGPLGRIHTMSALWIHLEGTRNFVLRGGREWNYTA